MYFVVDDLSEAGTLALLEEHLAHMRAVSPPESVHALNLDGLRADKVTFWTVRDGDDVLGCGALQELDPEHGEIKSMRTSRAHLRRGVASAMVDHLINEARYRCYTRLSLETGSGQAFEPAHALYRTFGFEYCGPFANYTLNPFSRFMTLEL